jgi:hypothetical protein
MSRYRVKKEPETIGVWVKGPDVTVLRAQPEDMTDVAKETVVIQAPTWNQMAALHTMATGGGMLPFAPDIDKFLLKYFLISTSFFEVLRDKEEDGQLYMTNLDEMLNEIHPALINFIILCLRQRM